MGKELVRIFRLFLGLFLYALGIVLTMKAHIGFAPWEVFHAGIGTAIGMSIGNVSIVAGLAIGLLALIMGERLGAGTICNMVFIGIFIDLLLNLGIVPEMKGFFLGMALLVAGLFTIALASYFYISSGYGAGPRDSLMVALTKKTHLPIGLCRGGLESLAVLIGWLLGGMVGIGTIVSALIIGFCIQITFRVLKFDPTKIHHEDLMSTLKRIRLFAAPYLQG
ncbi:MAG: hypothetical protein CVV52_06200 [Spirochaetae bacterium HGW-Spirochaetae-8]|nr:MAG: hypothetical protein CVV52_06200 [Spirochaetae bacterium HGW-Spirochaetae-8]